MGTLLRTSTKLAKPCGRYRSTSQAFAELRQGLIARHRRRARVWRLCGRLRPIACLDLPAGHLRSVNPIPQAAWIGLANETRPRLSFTSRWSVCGVHVDERRRISCPGLEL